MHIRRLRPDDETLAIRTVELLKPEKELNGNLASPSHMRALLATRQNYFIAACDGDLPVGFLIAHRFPRIDRDEFMIYLYEIGVDENYRRRGIGSKMIELLKDICQKEKVKIHKIWVGTEDHNLPARKLYKSTGAMEQPDNYKEYVYTL